MEIHSLSPWLQGLGKASVQAAVLVVVVLLAQTVFRRRLSPHWRAGLWLLVVARLLLPVSFSSTASLFNMLPRWFPPSAVSRGQLPQTREDSRGVPTDDQILAAPVAAARAERANELSLTPAETLTPQRGPQPLSTPAPVGFTVAAPRTLTRLTWSSLLLGTWLAGVLVLLVYLAVSSVRLWRRFSRLPSLTDPVVLRILDECRLRMGVTKALRIVESDMVATPALHGLLCPRLLLPHRFSTQFAASELRFVILHELAHLKRHDLALNWIVALLQVLYWFNPFVWLAFYCWRMDRELACDALALEAAGPEQHGDYGRTILRLLRDFTHRSVAPGMVGILEDRSQLDRRIRMIASFKPAKRAGLVSLALAAALGLV